MLGSIVECGQEFKVLFLVMSGTSSTACWAVLWNVFRRFGVWFLVMSGISDHYVLGSVVGMCSGGLGSGSGHVRALCVGQCCRNVVTGLGVWFWPSQSTVCCAVL